MRRAVRPLFVCLALALALASAGCGNKKAVEAIEGFTERACACEDAECLREVDEARLNWIEENPRPRGTESDRDKVREALEKYEACRAEVLEGGTGGAGGEGREGEESGRKGR